MAYLVNLPAMTSEELDVLGRAVTCYLLDLHALGERARGVSVVPIAENAFIRDLDEQWRVCSSLSTAIAEALLAARRTDT